MSITEQCLEAAQKWNQKHSPHDYFDCKSNFSERIQQITQGKYAHEMLANLCVKSGNSHRGEYVKAFFEIDQLPKAKKWQVLDIGCGYGPYGAALSRYIGQYTGLDISDIIVGEGNRAIQHAGIQNVQLVQSSTFLDIFDDNSFDFIFCTGVFIHLPKDFTERYIQNIGKKLKPEGRYIFHVCLTNDNLPRESVDHNTADGWQLYAWSEVEEMCEVAGLSIDNIYDWQWSGVENPDGFARNVYGKNKLFTKKDRR